MSNNKSELVNLNLVTIHPDKKSHITIKNSEVCQTECETKACTYYCPTNVYTWNQKEQVIEIAYEQCVECLACPFGCPHNNIDWQYPASNFGVDYTK